MKNLRQASGRWLYLFNNPTTINIGIDLRPLATRYRTGVGEYTLEFLNALFSIDSTNHYYLFYHRQPAALAAALPKWSQPNAHLVPTRWPHKLLNILVSLTGTPKLDQLIKKQTGVRLDYFFSPNLHFTKLTPATPHILMIHDLTFHLFKQYYTWRQWLKHRLVRPKKQCQQAHYIIAPSDNTKRDLIDYYQIPEEKITVFYPGLSSSFDIRHLTFDITKKYALPDKYILFLGTIEPRKNILGLIEAFEQAYLSLPTPHSLVITGAPGWKNHAVCARIRTSPIKNQIKLIGFVDPADKPALYRGASLFVYPSFYEGFGFPVLEAMASGVPVITSNRSSLPEVTGAGAYLVNPHRPDEIAVGIKYLLSHADARALAIKKGREQAARFSWKKTAQQFLSLIQNS